MAVCDVPCEDWTTAEAVRACEGCADFSDDVLAEAIAVASSVLYNWSERRFPGLCNDIVRPCARTEHGFALHGRLQRGGFDGWLPSWGWCSCNVGDACGCCRLPEVKLGGYPIQCIGEVVIDGVPLDCDAYRVDNDTTLVRIDGESWPCCQDLRLPDTEVGTWSVTYTYGREVDPGGQLSAKLYACEVAKLCGGGPCKLPARVQQITRQGVSAGVMDLEALIALGGLGIPFVDQWLGGLEKAKRGSRGLIVASPESARRVRRTGPVG